MILSQPLKSVYIAVPTGSGGKIHTPLVMRLIKWAKMGAEVVVVAGSILEDNRNICVRRFLKSKKKYLLFVDADTVPNVNDIEKLIKHKKEIIGGVYNLLLTKTDGSIGTKPSAFTMMLEGKPLIESVAVTMCTGLQKVAVMGTGYLLIHRDVFSKVAEPWFEIKWQDPQHLAFLGEDIDFCMKAEKVGIKIYCDTNCTATHIKEIPL